MERTIPEKFKTHNGIRLMSPFGKTLSNLPLGEIACPCCRHLSLRFDRDTSEKQSAGWTIFCDTCGWELPGPPQKDSDGLLNRLKRWCEAFFLLGTPSDRVDEDLSVLFDEDPSCDPRMQDGPCRYRSLCFPRSMAVFPCRLQDAIYLPATADDGTVLSYPVIELGVDSDGCYFRVDDEDKEKIRVDEIGASVFLSEHEAMANMSAEAKSPIVGIVISEPTLPDDLKPMV